MAWRGLHLSRPARLSTADGQIVVAQDDGEARLPKNEIGLAEQFLVAAPARDFMGAENRHQLELGVPVAPAFDRGHHLRPLPL